MSVLGTGVIAGAAAAAQEADRQAKDRDQKKRTESSRTREIVDRIEIAQISLEDGDDAGPAEQQRIGDQMPSHHAPDAPTAKQGARHAATPTPGPGADGEEHTLDIQA
jgi:hypothetical protein